MLNFHMSIQALHIYIYSSFQKLPKKQRVTMKRNSINIHHVTSFSSSPFWCVFFLVLLCKTSTNALVKQPPNETTPAIIVFGDSIVDAGNNDDIMTTLARCNYPPYGIDFDGGIPTGRFCNGKVATDFIAEKFGIKPSIPAYRNPNLKPEDLLTGVTFASGGAGYVPFTTQLSGGIALSQQLKLFEEYVEKMKKMVGEERTKLIIKNSLFMVICGSNDITNTYFGLPSVQQQYDVASFTTLMADNARSFAQKLHEYGARRIQVFGAPPVGCVPSQRTLAGGPTRNCVVRFNDATKLYNVKLAANLGSLSRTLGDKTIIYVDIYDSLLDIILDPRQYGFKVVDKGCCGTGLIEVALLCNNFAADVCPNRDEYVFWDSFHPTEKTYRIMATKYFERYV
ncbi:GDSL esterase/lipase EXL2 [Arabidopsis thaliana]